MKGCIDCKYSKKEIIRLEEIIRLLKTEILVKNSMIATYQKLHNTEHSNDSSLQSFCNDIKDTCEL